MNGHFQNSCRGARFLAGVSLFMALLLVGCETIPDTPPIPPNTPAHLRIVNQSDYEWRVTASPSEGGSTTEWILTARATVEGTLLPGNYAVQQTMLAPGNIAAASRTFQFTPEAGQTYRWRVGTLLSKPLDDSEDEEDSPKTAASSGGGRE